MRPKMADVARLAGVSLATVSRVLNQTKFVDPELEARVLRAIRELDYEPDQHARWLSSKRSNVVGLVIPDMEDSNLSEFLHACSVYLGEQGYDLMVALSDGDKKLELELLSAQAQSHVSGIILVSPYTDAKSKGLLRRSGVPFLYALNPDRDGRIPSVVFEERAAARELMRSALGAGANRGGRGVAIIAGDERESSTTRRVKGFTDGATGAGSPPPRLIYGANSIDQGYELVRELLREAPPGLLAATTDYLAVAANRAAYDAGVSVSGEMCVLGFGENSYSHTASPTISTVRLDGRLLGERCGKTIKLLMEGGSPERVQVLGFDLVPGESCPLSAIEEGEEA
ncbi:MAG: LacI family DNA-binding transcriptional regulator [Spirochaetaceae bacterium]